MSCYIDYSSSCQYIVNDVYKFYISEYRDVEVNYDSETDIILDIFDVNWTEVEFKTLTFTSSYDVSTKLYNSSVRISIDDIKNESIFFNTKKFFILFIDNNDNIFVDGVMSNDNGYVIENIVSNFDDETSQITFEMNKSSIYSIKQIDYNYYRYDNI